MTCPWRVSINSCYTSLQPISCNYSCCPSVQHCVVVLRMHQLRQYCQDAPPLRNCSAQPHCRPHSCTSLPLTIVLPQSHCTARSASYSFVLALLEWHCTVLYYTATALSCCTLVCCPKCGTRLLTEQPACAPYCPTVLPQPHCTATALSCCRLVCCPKCGTRLLTELPT